MKPVIDLSSDMGESFGRYTVADDSELLEIVTSANIACGFHAGDPRTMFDTVAEASKRGVGIGAHPGFPDLVGFGRRNMDLTYQEVFTDVLYQIGALASFVKASNGRLQHVFPHGQLANLATHNQTYAEAIADAVYRYDPALIIIAHPGALAEIAAQKGLRVAIAIFADRSYNEDGTLVSRSKPDAVISDPKQIVQRCLRMVLEQKVTAITGRDIDIRGHTLLLHGDTPGSVQLARKIKDALLQAGVEIRPLGTWFP